MSLASPGRRLSVHPLDILEGQGSRTLCGGGVEDGTSHSLLFASFTLSGSSPHAQLFSSFLQEESASGGNSFSASLRCLEDLQLVETCHCSLVPEPSRSSKLGSR